MQPLLKNLSFGETQSTVSSQQQQWRVIEVLKTGDVIDKEYYVECTSTYRVPQCKVLTHVHPLANAFFLAQEVLLLRIFISSQIQTFQHGYCVVCIYICNFG